MVVRGVVVVVVGGVVVMVVGGVVVVVGLRHWHAEQYWFQYELAWGGQQSPPSKLHSWLLLASSQKSSPDQLGLQPPGGVVGGVFVVVVGGVFVVVIGGVVVVMGLRHWHAKQYWSQSEDAWGGQQSPPSKLHSLLLLPSSQ